MITVQVEDSSGNVVTSSTATMTVVIDGPSGFSRTFTATVVNGVAMLDLTETPLTVPGDYTVTASSSGLTSHTIPVVVLAAASPLKLVTQGIAGTVAQGQGLGAFAVSIENADGSVDGHSSAVVTVVLSGPGGYSKTVSIAAVNGIARFDSQRRCVIGAGKLHGDGEQPGCDDDDLHVPGSSRFFAGDISR